MCFLSEIRLKSLLLKEISVFYVTLICFFVAFFGSLNTYAGTVYTYKDANGKVLITNRPASAHRYKLVKKVSFRPYRDRQSNGNSPYFNKAISSEYDALIINLSHKHHVDPALVKAIVHIESAFRRDAVSRAGAMGLMQLMPATAAIYDLKTNQFEPKKNLNAGIAHFKYLMNRYKGDKTLSLAAYNAGEGAVAKYNGIPPYEETQNYVVKVLKLYGKYRESFTG